MSGLGAEQYSLLILLIEAKQKMKKERCTGRFFFFLWQAIYCKWMST
ncbi:hypothetical protein PHAVU_001G204550 [Phaseolus vulgaris]